MKLAEALIDRADLQRKIARIENRMQHNAKVQEGDEPAEAVEKLIAEYERDERFGTTYYQNKPNEQRDPL